MSHIYLDLICTTKFMGWDVFYFIFNRRLFRNKPIQKERINISTYFQDKIMRQSPRVYGMALNMSCYSFKCYANLFKGTNDL